jgi:hypothetical protein
MGLPRGLVRAGVPACDSALGALLPRAAMRWAPPLPTPPRRTSIPDLLFRSGPRFH